MFKNRDSVKVGEVELRQKQQLAEFLLQSQVQLVQHFARTELWGKNANAILNQRVRRPWVENSISTNGDDQRCAESGMQ
jgi:hypothetical protein